MRHAVCIVALIVWLVGCGPRADDDGDVDRLMTPRTPLPIDPTQKIEVGPWWSNGDVLLRLDADGEYHLYADGNHRRRAVERGRWTRPSYAWLGLAPYAPNAEEARVDFVRLGDEIGLQMEHGLPLLQLSELSWMPEDDLIGTWTDGDCELVLGDDLVFTLTVDRVLTRGEWSVEDDEIILEPWSQPAHDLPPLSVVWTAESISIQLADRLLRLE